MARPRIVQEEGQLGFYWTTVDGRPVPLPDLVAPDRSLGESLVQLHRTLAFLFAILIGIHVAAAAYHHFVRKDDVARRMLPFMTPTGGDRP